MIVKLDRCAFGVRFGDDPQTILIMSQTLSFGEYLHDWNPFCPLRLGTYKSGRSVLERPVTYLKTLKGLGRLTVSARSPGRFPHVNRRR
jgi:hypothetical protein